MAKYNSFIIQSIKKTRRTVTAFLLLCFFCAFFGTPVSFHISEAAGAEVSGDDENIVRVGYFENEIFQEGAKEGAVRNGYAYDYYGKISEYTGWKYEYVYGSFADTYQMLLDGEVDMLAGLAKTEEREGIIGYPELPMGNETYNMVKHASDDSVTTSYKTLGGKRIGVLDSAMVGVVNRFLEENAITAKVVKYPDYERMFQEFDDKKVDVMAVESDGTQNRPDAELLYAFGTSDYYLCVSIKRPDLLEELNQAQTELMTEEPNYINSLRIKYFSESITSRSLTETEKDWLESNDVLRVGYLRHYLPYCDEGSDGQVTGLVRELVPGIIKSLDIGKKDISYICYENYDDMIADVHAGEVDVVFPVGGGQYFSEESGIYQSNTVVSSTTELIYKGDYDEQKLTSFAVNKNNRMQYYYVKKHFENAKFTYFSSIDKCLEAVMDGTVQSTTLNGVRANDILKNRKYRELSMKQLSINDDRCFGVRIGEEGLLKLLNRGINLVGADQIQSMAYRYVDGLYDYTFWDLVIENIWIVTLIVVAIAALVIVLSVRGLAASRKRMEEKEAAERELREKNTELALAVQEAQTANRAKTYFLSAMSHDIRTPMNSILSMNEMVLRECEDENILVYANHIRSSGNTLLGLISDILDFSKMEAGKFDIIPVDYEISSVLNDLVNMAQTRAEEKGLELELHIDSGIPNYLRGDETRVKQAVTNLLTNAVKYTKQGMIKLSVGFEKLDDEEDMILLNVCVKDTGVGIQKKDIETMFDAFERVDDDYNRNIEGTGLGLTITQRLLSLMGSKLYVDSEFGKGSEFSFSVKQQVNGWEEVGDYETAFLRSMAERKRYHEKFTAPDGYILVVDDVPANLVVFKNLLKRTKLNIDTANSADEGILYATRNKYDIIIFDHMMPYKDGIEALQELRAIEDNPNRDTPIICLTANAITGMRDTYIEAGFDDYLTKPIDPESLEDTIIRYLPDEKVFPAEDRPDEEEEESLPAFLYEIPELDVSAGLDHCGYTEAYLDAVRAYVETIGMNTEEIERYRADDDLANLTVRVHGMKSTARVIGALGLSAFAERLEDAGRSGDADTMEAEIDRFVEEYVTLGEKLMPIVNLQQVDDAELPEMSAEDLEQIYTLLKKHLENADYDEIDTLGEKLSGHRVPDDEKERVSQIVEAISTLEYDDIEGLL